MPPSSHRARDEAIDRFKFSQDTREDRDLLRKWRIEFVTVSGMAKRVPTLEDEEAALKPSSPEPVMVKRGPKVWRARPRGQRPR